MISISVTAISPNRVSGCSDLSRLATHLRDCVDRALAVPAALELGGRLEEGFVENERKPKGKGADRQSMQAYRASAGATCPSPGRN